MGYKFPKEYDNPKFFNEFLQGKKKITDHKGFVISPKGTKYDSIAQMAISEKEMKKIEKEKMTKMHCNECAEHTFLQPKEEEDPDDPYVRLRNYFRRKESESPKKEN